MWAKHAAYLTLSFPDDNNANNKVSGYSSTWAAKTGTFEWEIKNFNNNSWNNNWYYIKCGTSKASDATITTKSAIDTKIYSVVVDVDATKNSSANKLEVASDADFTANLQTINGSTLAAGEMVYNIPNPAANMYYRLTFSQSTGSNGDTQINRVRYCVTPEADDGEPAAVNTTPITWELNSSITGAFTKKGSNCKTANTLTATDGSSTIVYNQGKNDELTATYLKAGGKSTFSTANNPRFFKLQIAKSGVLTITSESSKPGAYLIYQSATDDITAARKIKSITTTAEALTASGTIDIANGAYVYIGWGEQLYTESLSWAEADGISLTTSDNMDGWRAFYDASQDYEIDANTTIYVAATSGTANKVTLTEVAATKIPHGEAVILKTSAGDHKMVLTKTTGAASLGANVLTVTDGTNDADGYRLGYKADPGVAFYKYTATKPAAGIVYIAKANVNTGAGAPEFLGLDFGSETTAIQTVNTEKQAVKTRKVMKDGRIVIETADGIFSLSGNRVK